MVLAHLDGNRAALYGLRIPLTPEAALARAGQELIGSVETSLRTAAGGSQPSPRQTTNLAPEQASGVRLLATTVPLRPVPAGCGYRYPNDVYQVCDTRACPVRDRYSCRAEAIRASVSNPPASGGWRETAVKYVLLAVASDAEAERLIQDLTENPDEPLRTPRWGNAVYAALTSTPNPRLAADEIVSTREPVV
jgi:hypothetical protein